MGWKTNTFFILLFVGFIIILVSFGWKNFVSGIRDLFGKKSKMSDFKMRCRTRECWDPSDPKYIYKAPGY